MPSSEGCGSECVGGFHCALCGSLTRTGSGENTLARSCLWDDLRGFLHSKCIPSKWHFAAVLAACAAGRGDGTGAGTVCNRCWQWRRRALARKTMRKVHTPFDSVFLHALAPGEVEKPDRRSLRRLVIAMDSPHNAFRSMIPSTMRTVISKTVQDAGVADTGDVELSEKLVSHWWQAQDCSPFFRSGATAKCIRHGLKASRRDDAWSGV